MCSSDLGAVLSARQGGEGAAPVTPKGTGWQWSHTRQRPRMGPTPVPTPAPALSLCAPLALRPRLQLGVSARLSLPCSQAAPEDGVPLICLLFQREALRLGGTCPLIAAATPSQDIGHLHQEGWGESGPGGHAFPDHTTLRPMTSEQLRSRQPRAWSGRYS